MPSEIIHMYRSKLLLTGALPALAAIAFMIGCSYNSPSAPDNATPGPEGATISITANGLSPNSVTIAAGQSVTFVNTDSAPHEIASTPVPTYDDCPALNRVGRLDPGQRMQSGALSTGQSCGFLDLLRTGDARWQGTISVR
jgi:plastocyanin